MLYTVQMLVITAIISLGVLCCKVVHRGTWLVLLTRDFALIK